MPIKPPKLEDDSHSIKTTSILTEDEHPIIFNVGRRLGTTIPISPPTLAPGSKVINPDEWQFNISPAVSLTVKAPAATAPWKLIFSKLIFFIK